MAEEQAIIIKKINKGGHGYHGGAWKVAYADFVTAMMAFFLLMWLLNATEAENLAGLADYFAPTVGVQGEMGIGFRGGKAALSRGVGADKNTNRGIVYGGVPTGPIMKVTEKIELVTDEVDAEKIKIIKEGGEEDSEQEDTTSMQETAQAVESYVEEEIESSDTKDSMSVKVTPEGIEIQISDNRRSSMFEKGSSKLKPEIMDILSKLSEIFLHMPNYIAISGHTNSVPLVGKVNYSNWELSADRANATRRFLVASGVPREQIDRVVGKSDNDPVNYKMPESLVNNRITITLLRHSVVAGHKKSVPDVVFIDPESDESKNLVEEKDGDKVLEEGVDDEKTHEENTEIKDTIMDLESAEEVISDEDVDSYEKPSINGAIPDNILFMPAKDEVSKVDEKNIYKQDSKMKDAIFEMEQPVEDEVVEEVGNLNSGGAIPDDILFMPAKDEVSKVENRGNNKGYKQDRKMIDTILEMEEAGQEDE